MTANERYTQNVAIFLIVFATFGISVGSHFGWHDLVTFSLTVGGGGVGILQGSRMSQMTNKDGGTINVNPTETQ